MEQDAEYGQIKYIVTGKAQPKYVCGWVRIVAFFFSNEP